MTSTSNSPKWSPPGAHTRRVKLAFLIRSLHVGGAERQLTELACALDPTVFDVTVFCFYPGGELTRQLVNSGIRVTELQKKGRWDVLPFLTHLAKALRDLQPEILHSYMTGANLVAAALRIALPRKTRIVWGIESSYIDSAKYNDWLLRYTSRFESLLSAVPDLIISNSTAGMQYCVLSGFSNRRMVVIPNGIDTLKFRPDSDLRSQMRTLWHVPDTSILIGVVGRLDPMKDHPTFLRAAALLARLNSNVRFACIGAGPQQYAQQLHTLAAQLELDDQVIWADFSPSRMSAAYNALDICTSSSYGEGMPNAIAEAMACGVPCVVTQVGDSPAVVGDTGIVVPPKNAEALAAGWLTMIERLNCQPVLHNAVRKNIESRLSISALVENTSRVLLDLV